MRPWCADTESITLTINTTTNSCPSSSPQQLNRVMLANSRPRTGPLQTLLPPPGSGVAPYQQPQVHRVGADRGPVTMLAAKQGVGASPGSGHAAHPIPSLPGLKSGGSLAGIVPANTPRRPSRRRTLAHSQVRVIGGAHTHTPWRRAARPAYENSTRNTLRANLPALRTSEGCCVALHHFST